jgi:hypothetical protein
MTRKRQLPVKIWLDKQEQTIAFELPELPGQVFKIVIPELISDTQEPIVPWDHPSPGWNLGLNSASYSIEIPRKIHMKAQVLFLEQKIETRVTMTNLSQRMWDKVNAFTCFAFYSAPAFDDPQLTRTYVPVEEGWKSIAQLFADHDPGDGPYTFFPVAGGPRLDDLWLCRKIPQRHPQTVSRGCACVVSSDGRWIAGMAARTPAYVFNNRRERCVHANQLIQSVAPGETTEGISVVYILSGTLDDFTKRCESQ